MNAFLTGDLITNNTSIQLCRSQLINYIHFSNGFVLLNKSIPKGKPKFYTRTKKYILSKRKTNKTKANSYLGDKSALLWRLPFWSTSAWHTLVRIETFALLSTLTVHCFCTIWSLSKATFWKEKQSECHIV